ncbi:hypothetical protein CONCODRAFT_11691 [Conidiobolus coronatus NRRL 28638]|uniref:Uncharacterized protein n=1 Tax=Conidiobolus coronatus (strain ATCC 28846 / CBS 209.66 / NRRL 28638) TaxID=796925 RepID=A0A137NUN3_CONC2|nr:hypothetical protein CONCODRAFT_11691 [Conidiobolus coronatus NRRL 28638]|eukprot:KXN66456.1 hypothetical protein CONCODRAFT_11691 [Conidiobolus coronatus NRRL 28638]
MLHTFGKFFVYTPQISMSFFGGEMFAFAGWFPYNTCFALFLRNQIKILYGSIKLHRFVDSFLCLVIIAGLTSSACFAAYCIDRRYTEEYVVSISIYLPVQVAFEEIVNVLTLYRCLKLRDKSGLRVSMVVMVFCLIVDIAFLIPDFFDPDQTWFILRPFTYQFKGLLEVIVFNHLRKLVAIRSLYDNIGNHRNSRASTLFLEH